MKSNVFYFSGEDFFLIETNILFHQSGLFLRFVGIIKDKLKQVVLIVKMYVWSQI